MGGQPADPRDGRQPAHPRIGLGGRHDPRLKRDDRGLQRRDLAEHSAQRSPQQLRDRRIFSRDKRAQFGEPAAARGGYNAELGELAAQAIHQLRALLDQQLARPLNAARRLLLDAPDCDKARVRPPQGGADRRRVARIVLVALDKRASHTPRE